MLKERRFIYSDYILERSYRYRVEETSIEKIRSVLDVGKLDLLAVTTGSGDIVGFSRVVLGKDLSWVIYPIRQSI